MVKFGVYFFYGVDFLYNGFHAIHNLLFANVETKQKTEVNKIHFCFDKTNRYENPLHYISSSGDKLFKLLQLGFR